MIPDIVTSDRSLDEIACDALIVGVSRNSSKLLMAGLDRLEAAFDGRLLEHLRDSDFHAKVGEVSLLPTMGRLPAKTLVALGLGDSDHTTSDVRRAMGAAGRRLRDRTTVAVGLAGTDDAVSEAAVEGLALGAYRFQGYHSEREGSKLETLLVLGAPAAAVDKGKARARATALARDVTNTPASEMDPRALALEAEAVAAANGLECTVWAEDALAERGFGGLLGVSQGSASPPRLIQLRYAPADANGKVVLIGKGITFDSGGLSMKDPKSMETMKTDKGGAAAVMGAMTALGPLGIRTEVVALLAASENMPGGTAIKPGDVIRHYGGRTTEVLNTDAEGRLVLADSLAYACELMPDAIVDVATLTGSIKIALGLSVSGLFSNDDGLRAEILEASVRAGEPAWAMPLFDDYRQELDSDVADSRNIGSGRFGGSIIAALFLRSFLREGMPWAHLDIAGTGRSERDHDEISKGATGVGARTLLHWLEARP